MSQSPEDRRRAAAVTQAAKNGVRLRFDTAGNAFTSKSDLQASMFGGAIPLSEQNRRYFGRSLTPEHIELVLRAAECGHMRDLTDLIKETIRIDPHLSSVVGKRFRSLASVRTNVIDAAGDGLDVKLAKQVGDVVRQQLAWVPSLKQNITRLNWGHCNGRAALEKVWRENPGGPVRWRLEKLHWIHPRRLSFGPERELRVRDDMFGGVGFEAKGLDLASVPFKFITFTPQQFDEYPELEGFGPRALYFSFFKRFGWRERLILLEVFGKPWRIVYTESNEVQQETLDEAAISADAMGANATGVMPPGVKLGVESPDHNSGQIHKDVSAECNDEISKLVLGTTRTTDAKPGALGSAGDEVGQEEQTGVVAADGWNLSDLLTEQLAGDITVLNFGPESLPYCPRVELQYEIPASRGTKIERTSKVYEMGIPLKASEVYENVGFSQPGPTDVVLKKEAAPAFPGAPGGAPPRAFEPAVPGIEGDGGNPLGDGGEAVPDGDQLRAGGDRDLAVLRAMRVLELVRVVNGGP